MRRLTPAAVLVRATPLLAAAAPFVMFGFLYVLLIQPARAGAQAASDETTALRNELERERALIRRRLPGVTDAVARREFEMRTPEEDRATEVAEAIVNLTSSPAVGGVTNLSIEAGAADGAPVDPRIGLFQQPVGYTPLSVTFDAPYAQIGRFFWSLRTLPSTFEVRSVEIEPAEPPLMRARMRLFVLQRVGSDGASPARPAARQKVDLTIAPAWSRNPFFDEKEVEPVSVAVPQPPEAPDPVVQSILFSAQRRVALVEGRIVKAGDRLGSGFVSSVEADGVILVTSQGVRRRLPLTPPAVKIVRR